MEKTKDELNFKKALFLTKIIFTFLIICLVLILNYLDFRDLKENSEYLSFLNKVGTTKEESFSEQELEHKISAWLAKTDIDLAKKYSNARKALSAILIKNGANVETVSRSKGYRGEKNNFRALAFKDPLEENNSIDFDDKTVKNTIDYFKVLARPLEIDILTSVDTSVFENKIKEIPKYLDNEMPPEQAIKNKILGYFEFERLVFKGDSVFLEFIEDIGQEQRRPDRIQISLPARHEKLKTQSPLVFAGFDSLLINKMHEDKSQLNKIVSLYGNQSIYKTEDLINKSIEENSGSVSILGFDISRRWFPFAMLFSLLIINILIMQNMQACLKDKMKIITNSQSDDALELLITNHRIRFSLWILSTLFISFSIYFTSLIIYPWLYYLLMSIISLATLVFGAISYKISLRQ